MRSRPPLIDYLERIEHAWRDANATGSAELGRWLATQRSAYGIGRRSGKLGTRLARGVPVDAITAALYDSSSEENIEFDPDMQGEDKVGPDKRNVFIVHGRDVARNGFFFDLLRQLDLHPLEFDELIAKSGSGSPYIGDIVRLAFDEAQAVIVLFTGDDLAHLRPGIGETEEPKLQPRPNVLFEAGMAIALQRDRTIIVEVPSLRGLSDLHGIHVLRFSTGSAEERHKLVTRLRTAGCEPNTSGTDWLNRPVFPQ